MVRRLSLIAGLGLGACGGGDSPQADAGGDDAAVDAQVEVDATAPRPRLVYVTDNSDSQLAVVELGIDGTLTAMDGLDVLLPGAPGPLAYGRQTRRLYAGLNGSVVTLDLDADGAPSLQAEVTTNANLPTYIGLFENETVMATAYFGQDEIRTHDVSGEAPHGVNATLPTADQPHAAFPGPDGLVYVPHRDGGTTRWFSINDEGDPVFEGELTDPGVGPRHIAFTPDGRFAYIINEMGLSISAHTVAADGTLTRIETVDVISDPVGGESGADVHVTPDGKFVYGSYRGVDLLSMHAINADGTLTSLGTVSTEARPREFDVSPDGRFVVVCGQDSGFLQSFGIESDGTLAPVDRLQLGDSLLWAIID
jgi:6-phosphogluconolactonase